ncbi:hypothetical protein KY285_007640 [Solanum tuberosum]|nr:hypothetical protein KY289_007963 [Solanum tuberosum]KAH0745983.1 hypothetical protein KY285_007640 [Solanum tuberosum]
MQSTRSPIPWLVIGDFNSVLNSEDKLRGHPVSWAEVIDFQTYIDTCGLVELAHNGPRYTWNDRNSSQRIYSRIDWMFINNEWLTSMPACKAMYLNEGISDHCPIKITFEENNVKTRRAFKYCNVWSKHPQFKHVILEGWGTLIDGYKMLQVIRRLKLLKKELKKLNSMHFRNIVTESNEDRVSL